MRLGKYLKAAFTYHWNLLAFLGAMGFSLVSGAPDVFVPLVLAGEAVYLGLLAAHPKFQRSVDARNARADREVGLHSAEQTMHRILTALPDKSVERFETLRSRCLELRQIALELKQHGSLGTRAPLDELQLAGLDRLLWIYLRLLYTEFTLARFLKTTSEERIRADVDRLEQRLARLEGAPEDSSRAKARTAIEDNLQTSRDRLANLQKAQENFELVQLEIDRVENKIRSLAEMAVNRQDPDFIVGQVDQVASSMVDTERTMNELRFVTGFDQADEEVPQVLRGRVAQTG